MSKTEVKVGELFPIQYDSPNCFACGPENPIGMKLRFTREGENSVSTLFTPPANWTGWGDILHGGFQALLLDETMSWTIWGILAESAFVTAKLSVSYIKPVRVGQELKTVAKIKEDCGKTILVDGEIQSADGTVLAKGEGIFARVDPSIFKA